MLKGLFSRVVGDSNEREVRKIQPLVDAINALEPEMEGRIDALFRASTGSAQVRTAPAAGT